MNAVASMLNDYADLLQLVGQQVGVDANRCTHRGHTVKEIRAAAGLVEQLAEAVWEYHQAIRIHEATHEICTYRDMVLCVVGHIMAIGARSSDHA